MNETDKENLEKIAKGIALAGTVVAGIIGITKKK